ncbi:MAG: ABC transporter permease [Clostridiales Family XIII bacterium]|nr:ABC transporter permease [Clostridiales Family XIII bacterium]
MRMITGSLLRRRSRMFIALLAVAIGATILSGLVTVDYDIPRQMGQEFRSYGANLILVPSTSASASMSGSASDSGLASDSGSDSDSASSPSSEEEGVFDDETIADAMRSVSPEDIVGVAPYRYEAGKINEQPFLLAGTDLAEVRKTSPYWFVSGEWPEVGAESGSDADASAGAGADGGADIDAKAGANGVALIGQEVADVIRLVPGDSFTLTGTDTVGENFTGDFTVSGIVQTGGDEEGFIFLSSADLNGLMGDDGRIDVVECSISASQDELTDIAARIGKDAPGVSPRLVKRVTESEGAVLTKLKALVWLVTAVVLLLTMITVATTMMAVVAERRREIGLRKALGASDRSIAREFLGEGALLGGSGG